jgi:hypothetical protein
MVELTSTHEVQFLRSLDGDSQKVYGKQITANESLIAGVSGRADGALARLNSELRGMEIVFGVNFPHFSYSVYSVSNPMRTEAPGDGTWEHRSNGVYTNDGGRTFWQASSGALFARSLNRARAMQAAFALADSNQETFADFFGLPPAEQLRQAVVNDCVVDNMRLTRQLQPIIRNLPDQHDTYSAARNCADTAAAFCSRFSQLDYPTGMVHITGSMQKMQHTPNGGYVMRDNAETGKPEQLPELDATSTKSAKR